MNTWHLQLSYFEIFLSKIFWCEINYYRYCIILISIPEKIAAQFYHFWSKKKKNIQQTFELILTFLRAIKLLSNDCSAKTLYFFNGGYIDKNFSRNSPEKVGQKRRGKREVLNKCLPRNRKSGWPRGYEIFTRWLVRNFLGGSWSEWVDSQKSLDKTTIVRFDASGIVRYIVRLPIGNGEMCAAKNIVAETCVSFEKLYFSFAHFIRNERETLIERSKRIYI